MNCGSICRKVTKIRWSLSYYNYVWLVSITKGPFSKWSSPVTETGPSDGLRGLSPLCIHCHRSQLSLDEGLGEIPVLGASPSCHFIITSILPSLDLNSLLETHTVVEAKGSQCTDRHKQSYRVKVIIFHAQSQRREALMLKACC